MSEFFNNSFDKTSNLQNVTNTFFTSKRDLNTILYGIQYNSSFCMISFIAGNILEYVFPEFNAKKKKSIIVFEVLFQIIIMSIFIHYIKKYGCKIPFILGDKNNVDKKVNKTVFIILTFLFTQQTLIQKIKFLSKNTISYINNLRNTSGSKLSINKKSEIKKIVKQLLQNKLNKDLEGKQYPQQQKQKNDLLQSSPMLFQNNKQNQIKSKVATVKPKNNWLTSSNTMPQQKSYNVQSNMSTRDFSNLI